MTPIFRTLAYHHLFQDPLTIEQIHEFLITPDPIPLASVRRSVEQMLRKRQAIRYGSLYALPHFAPKNMRQHADRVAASREKMMIARRAAKGISFIPWVKLVAVTGALAMENADESDDIDLMIVTEKNRLWLTRPLVMLFVSLFFKRRRPPAYRLPPTAYRNVLCLNLWLDDDALTIPRDQQNLYTAHELAQMKPLVNREQTYESIMSINKWGRKFLANAWKEVEGRRPKDEGQRKKRNKIYDILNTIAFYLQLRYMKSKMTTERVSLHAAYFHPGNRSREVLDRYSKLLHQVQYR